MELDLIIQTTMTKDVTVTAQTTDPQYTQLPNTKATQENAAKLKIYLSKKSKK